MITQTTHQLLVGRSHTPVLGTEDNVDRPVLRTSSLEELPQGKTMDISSPDGPPTVPQFDIRTADRLN